MTGKKGQSWKRAKKNTTPVTAQISEELSDLLDDACANEGKSKTWIVNKALELYFYKGKK